MTSKLKSRITYAIIALTAAAAVLNVLEAEWHTPIVVAILVVIAAAQAGLAVLDAQL